MHPSILPSLPHFLSHTLGRFRWTGVLAALLVLLFGFETQAKVPKALRPGTHPMAFMFGLGSSMRITNSYSAFKLSQEFNGHFSGNASGPALGILMEEEFAALYNRFGLTIAPKFVYDIPVYRPMGIYVSPSVSFGYNVSTCENCRTIHSADLQFGVAGKLIINNRMMVWFQPTNFNLLISPNRRLAARYEVMLGGAVIF